MNLRSSAQVTPPSLQPILSEKEFCELAELDSCSVANAIERFNLQLRNEGHAGGELICRFPQMPPMLGYAFTVQARSGAPPSKGRSYFENTLWMEAMFAVPAPRILVVQDMDRHPGAGALIGEVHAEILRKLDCIGVVTNGAVRDLPKVERLNFHMYSTTLSVSHGYSHVVHIGGQAQVGGMEVHAGDLLHGDCHGILRIPRELATRIPSTAHALRQKEQEISAYVQSADFNLEGLGPLLDS